MAAKTYLVNLELGETHTLVKCYLLNFKEPRRKTSFGSLTWHGYFTHVSLGYLVPFGQFNLFKHLPCVRLCIEGQENSASEPRGFGARMSFWETFPRCLASLRLYSPVQPCWELPTDHDGLNSWSPQKRAKEGYGRVTEGVFGDTFYPVYGLFRERGAWKLPFLIVWIPVLTVSRYNRGLILLCSEASLRHPWCWSWLELNFVVRPWEVWAGGYGWSGGRCLVGKCRWTAELVAKEHVGPSTSIYVAFCSCCCCNCLIAKSCPTPWDPVERSPPDSSVHGISQARILEWVAIFFLVMRHDNYNQNAGEGNSMKRRRVIIINMSLKVTKLLSDPMTMQDLSKYLLMH